MSAGVSLRAQLKGGFTSLREDRWLPRILIAALLLRLALAGAMLWVGGEPEVFHRPDTGSYVQPAQELLESGRYTSEGRPELFRTPGYPLFLLAGVWLGEVELVTVFLQALVGTVTVWLLYRIGVMLGGGRNPGRAAAALYAVEPLALLYVSQVASETVFAALAVAALWAILRGLRASEPGTRWFASGALLLAAAAFVRPIGLYLPLVPASVLVWRGFQKREERRELLGGSVLLLLIPALCCGMWMVRNARVGDYAGFSTVVAQNAYFYQAAAVRAEQEDIRYYEMRERLGYGDRARYLARHPEQRSWSQGRIQRWRREQGLETLKNHPLRYAALHLRGNIRLLITPGATDYLKGFGAYPVSGGLLDTVVTEGITAALVRLYRTRPLAFWSNVVLGAVLLGYYLLAGMGLLGVLRDRRETGSGTDRADSLRGTMVFLLLLTAAYLILASGGPMGASRFRHPVMPLITVLGGVGFAALWMRGKVGL